MPLSAEDIRLFAAVGNDRNEDNAEAVPQAIRDGANVNAVQNNRTPLMLASERGYDQIIRVLLDAGADPRWRDSNGWSVIEIACNYGHLSTVQLLISHDSGLLEVTDSEGWTPLFFAISRHHSDIVRFLLDSGADPNCVDHNGKTALMIATNSNHEIVRLLLAAGVAVEARDDEKQTALHHAADWGNIGVVRELILQHNANMFAVDEDGRTPFDLACVSMMSNASVVDVLLEMHGNKLTQDHGSIALHELLKVAEYSFAEDEEFHPPLNPLRIILPLGKLTLKHVRTLLHNLDPEVTCNRDDTGKSPLHVACQTNAPVEVLALILELDPTALHIVDFAGALPIHLLLCGTIYATEYASVLYLVERGGDGTLAARNRQGLVPLHVVCGKLTNFSLRAVQYLTQSFPGSVAMRTNAGDYPFMIAAAAAPESSLASLSIVYELVRATPGLVVPR